MRIQLVQTSKPLRHIPWGDTTYVEAPLSGNYWIRVINDSNTRKLAVISVDGINVVDGTDASHSGAGYIIEPYAQVDIPGWKRTDGTAAHFTFAEASGGSYAAQTGRGTDNVGVVGAAVFDEYVKPAFVQTKSAGPFASVPREGFFGSVLRSATSSIGGGMKSADPFTLNDTACQTMGFAPEADKSVGTGYGEEVTFHTRTMTFTRASQTPVQLLTLRYATRAKLASWGVPVDAPTPPTPNPFPAQAVACPAPPGWNGSR